MNVKFGKPVSYDATAVRPSYDTLPTEVRADIAARLGGEPVHVNIAGGGFSGGFAGLVTDASGRSLFVKAAGPDAPHVVSAYSREAHLNPALPDGVPAPRVRYSAQVGDWVVLGIEPVIGKAPRLPFSPTELDLMLAAWAQAAEALTPAPASIVRLGVNDFTDDAAVAFTCFQQTAAGERPVPFLPEEARGRIDELAELEAQLPAAVTADAITHGDLRPDNMILGEDQAWICDWNFSCVGGPWFDTVALLVVAHGDGHDAERLFWEHPTAADVTSEQLDVILAAIGGYYLGNVDKPIPHRVSPHLSAHRRWNGLATLDWLGHRRGW